MRSPANAKENDLLKSNETRYCDGDVVMLLTTKGACLKSAMRKGC